MKYRWQLDNRDDDIPADLVAAAGSELVARILAGRGIVDAGEARRFLDPDAYQPAPPEMLHDMEAGVGRIERALKGGERVLVWGDFDVDGQTSTALLVEGLSGLGGCVEYHIPVRARESHGIGADVLETYLAEGFGLVVTCDTGIAAVDAVALAVAAGVDVVVTDHHDLPAELPAAQALVNPKFGADHPLRELPGVGVAYKLIEALYQRAGRATELEAFLDLVAVGIVADLASQVRDCRYLLQRGLAVLRETTRPGLLALMENAGLVAAWINDEQIGFQLGPRLNAVGRLADSNVSVPLLTTDDREQAEAVAVRLEQLNEERKFETTVVYESAVAQLNDEPALLQYAALVLAHPRWHQGVIGIVASRLVEQFGKPTILIAAAEGEPARGSARSVEGYHITQAIATQDELLYGYGGHPMAAGLSMDAGQIEAFRRGVSKAIIDQRSAGKVIEPALRIEAELPLEDVTLQTAVELERLAPFGQGNPPINVLCRGVEVETDQLLGKEKVHRKLLVGDGSGRSVEVLWWNGADEPLPEGVLDLVVRMRPGFFRGERQLTVTLQDFAPAGQATASDARAAGSRAAGPAGLADLIDCRSEADPDACLGHLGTEEPEAQVWSEAIRLPGAVDRGELVPGPVLVIWTLPPDHGILRRALDQVRPERLYLFAVDPQVDAFEAFVRRLAGLVKYAVAHYEGETELVRLAAAMAHSSRTLALGLEVLPVFGVRASVAPDGHRLRLERCDKAPRPQAEERLRAALAEARAFRKMLRLAADVAGYLGMTRAPVAVGG